MKIYPTIIIILLTAKLFAQTTSISGFTPSGSVKQFELEKKFDAGLNREHIGENIKHLSAKPHNVGSPGSKENAEYILSLYKSLGWDAKIETFKVLFPTPKTRLLEMTGPTSYKALLKEPAIREDATSGQPGQLP